MKTTTINGIQFEFKKYTPCRNGKTELRDLYKDPSYKKEEVFSYWKDQIRIYWMKWNSSVFSIFGTIMDPNGIQLDVWITPCHNYILKSD